MHIPRCPPLTFSMVPSGAQPDTMMQRMAPEQEDSRYYDRYYDDSEFEDNSYHDAYEHEVHMPLGEGTLLRQFLCEAVPLASNLRTLSCSVISFDKCEFGCGTVALYFPQLARLHVLELEEGRYVSRRCFLAVYIAL